MLFDAISLAQDHGRGSGPGLASMLDGVEHVSDASVAVDLGHDLRSSDRCRHGTSTADSKQPCRFEDIGSLAGDVLGGRSPELELDLAADLVARWSVGDALIDVIDDGPEPGEASSSVGPGAAVEVGDDTPWRGGSVVPGCTA